MEPEMDDKPAHWTRGSQKRVRIQRAVGAGTIVTVQEAHWSESDVAIWSGMFIIGDNALAWKWI